VNPAEVVRDIAASREQSMRPRQMTIAEAFEEARWLRRTPDGILSPEVAKRTIETLYAAIDAYPSLRKALERGQEIFVLVEQDRCASAAITQWANVAKAHGCPPEKVAEAYRKAVRWLELPETGKKWPD
jgi:hypothetical protein